MQSLIKFDFNQPLLDSMNKEMNDRPHDFLNNLINDINKFIGYEEVTPIDSNFSSWQKKYDEHYSQMIKSINTLNVTTVVIKQKHIILLNVLEAHEGTKNLFEVETIGKVRKHLNNDGFCELSLQESIFLKKIILESKIKTIYKQQLLEQFKDING